MDNGSPRQRSWLNFADEAPSKPVDGGDPAADEGTGEASPTVGIAQPTTRQVEEMPGVVALDSAGSMEITALSASQAGELRGDPQLIREVLQGDHGAFAVLVRRYSERAYRAAYRVVRDPHQAEEIVQEALIKAYRALDGFELRSSFYTWLYKIVVNLALDRRRRESRAPNVEWDDSVAPRVDPRALPLEAEDPELASRRREVREFVAQGVKELPDAQREVLLLREVEGLSYEEIAVKMRISKGTVMSRLHYARKKMVAFLTQCGVEPEDLS
jgi:RNA polymerase sigma-70 factor (ECF subfamily)